MRHMRKNSTLELVRRSTGRDPQELIRELYIDQRLSDQEIAAALSAKADYPIGRAAIQAWRTSWAISRDARPPVTL